MNPKERTYSEEETRRRALEELVKIFPRLSAEADSLKNMSLEDDHFSPDASAEAFGKPDMTIKEYFEAEMKNLQFGMTFFKGDGKEQNIAKRYEILSSQLDKVLKPEKFIAQSLSTIMGLISIAKRGLNSRDIEDLMNFRMSDLENEVLRFNKYLKQIKGFKIEEYALKKISEINDELNKIGLPLGFPSIEI